MNTTRTETGKAAEEMIAGGVEVNADIEWDEDGGSDGYLAAALLPIVQKWGAKKVLAVIHDAALGGAEVHEEQVNEGDMTPLRLQIFCGKIRAAMDCLK
jgi:hypothetical protein